MEGLRRLWPAEQAAEQAAPATRAHPCLLRILGTQPVEPEPLQQDESLQGRFQLRLAGRRAAFACLLLLAAPLQLDRLVGGGAPVPVPQVLVQPAPQGFKRYGARDEGKLAAFQGREEGIQSGCCVQFCSPRACLAH